nr:family 20 glycosylhydrolase [Actinomyces sp.]
MRALSASGAMLLAAVLPVPTAAAAPADDPGTAAASAYDPQATASLPSTIPSLDGWTSSGGTWTLLPGARVVSSDESLAPRAATLATELSAYLSGEIPAVTGSGPDSAKDVELVKDEGRLTELGKEGFELTTGAEGLKVVGASDIGVFYGTRSVSQLLRQGTLTLPAGTVVSKPQYVERGVTLCACQINVSEEWISQILDDMADLRLNYLLLEMKLKSDTYPDTNTYSYYTKEDVKRLVTKARSLGIDVIPEINSPGHMNVWLENSPQYQLTRANGSRRPDGLDISKPEARQLYKDLIDEYDDVFDSAYWHMGADEYMMGESYNQFPQIERYAKETYGAQATAADAFTGFINEINAYVKDKGKTLRIWNDGVIDTQAVTLDKDIVVEYWLGSGLQPAQLAERGYTLMNASQALYWSRSAKNYDVNSAALYDNPSWNIGTFDGNRQIDPGYEGLRGAKVSIWPDRSDYETENEVAMYISDGLRLISQMTWSASRPWTSWGGENGMKAAVDSIGKPQIRHEVPGTELPDGTYVIPGLEQVGAGPWQLTATYDGYYQVRDTATGTCLSMFSGSKHLAVVTQVGARPELRPCADMSVRYSDRAYRTQAPVEHNPQKWRITHESVERDGQCLSRGLTLRNALSNQYLALATGEERHVDLQGVSATDVDPTQTLSGTGTALPAGTLAQLPGDLVQAEGALTDNAVFSFSRQVGMQVASSSLTEVNPASPGEVTLTLTAGDGEAVPASTVTMSLPEGWTGLPASVDLPEIPAGATTQARFTVVNTTASGDAEAVFTWSRGQDAADMTLRTAMSATLGPRLCSGFSDLSADSEEKVGEGAVNGHVAAAFDDNDATFWHTQWKGGTPGLPHWLVFNPTQALDGSKMLAVEYLSRQGKVNGRIKDYRIYVSPTAKAGSDDWGAPVLSGTWESSAQWQQATFPEALDGQYVKLEITDVWDEFAGTEDQFASAAGICVQGALPAVELTAPEQPGLVDTGKPVTPSCAPTQEPETPVEPSDPATPAQPSDPATPTQPSDPATPAQPSDPAGPASPGTPLADKPAQAQASKQGRHTLARTGTAAAALCLVALAAIGGGLALRRRRSI